MGIFGFNNDRRGSGFGAGMPGFNRGKRGTVSSGNWDLDRKPNRIDCDALNWRKQEGGEPFAEDLVKEAEGMGFDEKTDVYLSKLGRGELRTPGREQLTEEEKAKYKKLIRIAEKRKDFVWAADLEDQLKRGRPSSRNEYF